MSATTTDVLIPAAPEEHVGAWRPNARGWAIRIAVIVALFALLIWGVNAMSPVWASRVALAAVYAIVGLSLNIVMGYVGQVSLGHHGFVGLAAFASAFMITKRGQSFGVGVLTAVVVGALSAGLLGMVALRIKGLYLALITLTFGLVCTDSLFEIPALTGGGQGLESPRPQGFSSDYEYAFLCLAVLAVVIFIDWRLIASKVGRAILAIKHSEAVASSYAVNVTAYKVLAFVISGAFAGLAGALFSPIAGAVVATDFQFGTALLWVLMVVVGGLGRRTGVVIGSAFFALFPFLIGLLTPLEHFLADTLKRQPDEFDGPIGAVLALLTIILHPGGIADQVAPVTRWLSGKRFSFHGEDHKPQEKEKHGNKIAKALGISKANAADPSVAPETGADRSAAGETDTDDKEEVKT